MSEGVTLTDALFCLGAFAITGVLSLWLHYKYLKVGSLERLLRDDAAARVFGLCGILLGTAFIWTFVAIPVRTAVHARATIFLMRGTVVFPFIFIGCGLVLLLAGQYSHRFVLTRHGQQPNVVQTIVILGLSALAFGMELAFHQYLQSLGYQVKFGFGR